MPVSNTYTNHLQKTMIKTTIPYHCSVCSFTISDCRDGGRTRYGGRLRLVDHRGINAYVQN